MPAPRLTPRPPPSLVVLLAAVVLALGAVEVALVRASGYAPLWVLLLFVWVGWVAAGAGLLAIWRRPANRLGAVLVLLGLSWLAAGYFNSGIPVLEGVGGLAATLPLAVVVHLLHAFPSGRLVGLPSRLVVLAGYAVSLALAVPQVVYLPGALSVAVRPEVAHRWYETQNLIGSVVMALTAVVLLSRLRGYQRPQRRVVVPLFAYGVLAVALVPLTNRYGEALLGLDAVDRAAVVLVVLGGVPVAFTLAVLRGGFARTGELQELAAWLGESGARRDLSEAVARTLGDPGAAVVFAREGGGFVDAVGSPVAAPPDSRVPIELDGSPVGAIVYDTRLDADPAAVEAAAAVIAIAVDRERLTADLLASRAALRRSSVRLVDAADRERRRIAQDLHDGVQADLIVLALTAGRLSPADDATALRLRLDAAAADLRALVHGLMPALLVERGLFAAVEDLADRLPVTTSVTTTGEARDLPPSVEGTAYLVVAEALANAVKHARASSIAVHLTRSPERLLIEVRDDGVGGAVPGRGAGLTGIADRVAVLGGRMRLDSPDVGGTSLFVELPCAS